MKKRTIFTGFLFLLMFISMATALTVSPTKIETTINRGDISFYEITLTNEGNVSEEVLITSSDTAVVVVGISSLIIPPNSEVKFLAILQGEGLAYIQIMDSDTIRISVDVSFTKKEGFLEPDFVRYKRSYEEGVTSKMRLSLRNHYPEMIEIRDAIVENAVTTQQGVSKPIGVEGQLGFVDSGGDLTLDIMVDTTDLDPGVYTPELYIIYYYNDERFERRVDFEITVITALTPSSPEPEEQLKELDILFNPENPKVGDTVAVNLVDAVSRNWMEGSIRVTEIDPKTGEKKISYIYSQPLVIGSYEYCINASKEGYNSKERCFQSALQEAKIKVVPSPELNQLSVVSMVDLLGHTISGAELTIDGDPYENQATITFESGKHSISGKATGYKEAKKTFEIKPQFSYRIINKTGTVGDELVISFSYSIPWFVESEDGTAKSGSGSTLYFTPEKSGEYYVIANEEIIHEFTVDEKSSLWSIPSISIPWWGYVIGIIFVVGFLYKYKRPKKEVKVGYGLGGARERPAVLQDIEEE